MTTFLTHFNLSAKEYEVFRSGYLADRRRNEVRQVLAARATRVQSVLEIGCGTGVLLARLAEQFPALRFVGADIEPKMIDYSYGES